MRLSKGKRINWLSLVGVFLSLIGSSIIIMDNFPSFRWFVNTFSRFGKVEKGWRELRSKSVLDMNEDGFQEILQVILDNRPEYSNKRVIAISNYTQMSHGELRYNVISLRLADRPTPIVVATEEVAREWISIARLKLVLLWGFIFLFFGFFFSLVVHFRQPNFKSGTS